ncbi:hypothetical protein [Haloarcula argentinensis]|uniref:Uncharacterized protein n=1 Tax=Haloarcula argentinensis TaxID=43776 RepID=A0A847UF46_HALAR|nr:hypothetical protein [Haloarcula argentinensis]NLV14413.1 hypothetical protein [Haloarcula argentinensis]
MMDKIKQIREAKHEIENPHESDRLKALAGILAEIEVAQRAAVMDQREAAGIDPDDGRERIDKQARMTEILDLVDGYGPGGRPLSEVWVDECCPVDGDPAALSHYAEMSESEWNQQIERWATTIRNSQAGEIEATDRELADHHTSEKWGVTVDRFEQEVICFEPADALEALLAGPSKETEQAIKANTEALA